MKVFRVVWLVLANTQPVRHQQKQASIEEWWGRARGGSGNPFGTSLARLVRSHATALHSDYSSNR
jgi:hypothetical protein